MDVCWVVESGVIGWRCARNGVVMSSGKKRGKNPSVASGKISPRGFGSRGRSGSELQVPIGDVDRSEACEELFRWLRGAGASLNRVALAEFAGMRGVMALEDIEVGEVVCSVPQEMSLKLCDGGSNPGVAAVSVLDAIRQNSSPFAPALEMLPGMDDARAITDFFSEEELQNLQWPDLVEETNKRKRTLNTVYDRTEKLRSECSWDEFLWASFIVVSRAFTLQQKSGESVRCLVPLMDMFNHSSQSKTELRVRNGSCRVIAGEKLLAGQEVTFGYGGGRLSNKRLIQDYGFVQLNNPNDASIFLGQGRSVTNPYIQQRKDEVNAQVKKYLSEFPTTFDEDTALLEVDQSPLTRNSRNAILFRRELKRTLLEIESALNP